MGVTAMADVLRYTPRQVRVELFARGIQVRQFAEMVGVGEHYMSAVLSNRREPSPLLWRAIVWAMKDIEAQTQAEAVAE